MPDYEHRKSRQWGIIYQALVREYQIESESQRQVADSVYLALRNEKLRRVQRDKEETNFLDYERSST